ncbi:MAG: hypothetical protein EHM61_23760, partial [Acidobacteria bacterium]
MGASRSSDVPLPARFACSLNTANSRWPTVWILVGVCLVLRSLTPVLADVTTWRSLGPGGGAIGSIAVSPSDPNIVLAGTVGAGVLRSTDRGASWRYSNQGLLNRG